jgi:hypothetical protein
LAKLADQIARGTGPKGQDKIARAVGRIENRYIAKLFDFEIFTPLGNGRRLFRNTDRRFSH